MVTIFQQFVEVCKDVSTFKQISKSEKELKFLLKPLADHALKANSQPVQAPSKNEELKRLRKTGDKVKLETSE